MNNLKPYWGANYDYMEGSVLVFAENRSEAKQITFKHFPFKIEWLDVRVRKADLKWMKLYDGSECIDYYEGDYETWGEYFEGELE